MHHVSKRVRITLNIFGGLLALALAVVLILSTPWAQRQIERRVITAIESATGARVEIGHFRVRPLSLQFVLHNLVLHGQEPAGAPPMFSAETVIARLRSRAIIERKPLFASLDWDKAEIHISTQADGSTNLTEPSPQEGAGASVNRVTLSKTSIFWDDREAHVDLDASNLAVLVRRTRSGKYAGSVSVSQVRVRGPKGELPRISLVAQAEFSRSGLETQALSWQCAGVTGRGKLSVSRWKPLTLNWSYETGGDIRELAGELGLREIRGGAARLQGILSYDEKAFEAQGKVAFREVGFQTDRVGIQGISASANFSANSNRISFTDLTGTLLDGNIHGNAGISFKRPEAEFRIEARANRLSVRRLIQAFPTGDAGAYIDSRASGTATVSWTGNFRNFRGRYKLDFAPDGSGHPGVLAVAGSLEGTSRFDPELVLEIDRAEFRTHSSAASARGTLGTNRATLALAVSVTDFEEWRPLIEPWLGTERPIRLSLQSPVTFRGEVAGSVRDLEWRGALSSGAFDFHGTHWDKLRADILISPKLVQVTSGHLGFQDGVLRLDAELPMLNGKLDSTRPMQVSVNAEKTRLEGLLAALDEKFPLRGSLTGKLDLHGSPDSSNGGGQIRIQNGTLYDEPFDELSLGIRVERSVWEINDIVWKKGQGLARGEGELNYPARQFRIALSGDGFRLGEVERLRTALDIPPSDLQGQISFDIRAHGWPDAVETEVTAEVRDILAKGMPVGNVTARVIGHGKRMEMKGESRGSGGTIQFSGEGSIGERTVFGFNAEYQALRLDPWLQLLTARESAPKMIATGKVRGKYWPSNPESTELSVQADQFSIEHPDMALKAAGPLIAHYAARRVTFERFRLQGPATNLEVEGTARFGLGGSLALRVEGTAEATLLSLVDPALQASGDSTLNLRVTGSFNRPAMHGSVKVQNVNVGYGDLPFRVSSLTGEVVLEGDRATLRSLSGISGGGRIALNGFVDFGAGSRFTLQADLNQVRVRFPTVFTSTIEGSLRLTGSSERGEISGDLVVRQIFSPENFNWLAYVSQAGSSPGVSRSAIESPIAPKIRLNVRVQTSPAVRFETRDLRLVGDIDVRLQGTLAEPVEVGHIQILSGEAVFRGNRYTIRRGDISMTNPFRTAIVLNLEAQTRVQRYDLTVNISGPVDSLKITYRSDPPLPTSDIVTLLAFGYARQQEEMATGSSHPAATVGASALLSQALSTQTSGRIQRLFGVSRIKIDPNAGGVGTTGGALITVEQQVAPDLTLTYVTNTGISQYRIIRVEWNVTDRMSIIGERDQAGILGMELQFRQRFR